MTSAPSAPHEHRTLKPKKKVKEDNLNFCYPEENV